MLVRTLVAALALIPATAGAQIIGVELSNNAARVKYAAWEIEKQGKPMVVGEVISGLVVDVAKNTITKPDKSMKVVMIVPDPARPELAVVEPDGKGGRRVLAEGRVISLDFKEIQAPNGKGIQTYLLYPNQTCVGLRTEWLRKSAELDASRAKLKTLPPGAKDTFVAQRSLLGQMESASAWLRLTLYPTAAARLEKEYGSDIKRLGDVGSKMRLEVAKKALKSGQVPAKLVEKTAEFGLKDLKWQVRETQHLRMTAPTTVDTSRIDNAMLLAERMIEGFRGAFVDPGLEADQQDPIPEGIFDEWFLCPDDEASAINFYEKYYGLKMGEPRAEVTKLGGFPTRGGGGADYLEFFRSGASDDLEGKVAHRMGHVLANIAFNRSQAGGMPDWLSEGFAYWMSFEYLSRNSLTCFAWSQPKYAKVADKQGVKPTEMGMRAGFNDLALAHGAPLQALMRLKLVEMETSDFAKAWSFVDYLATAQRPQMTRLARSACECLGKDERMDVERFRERLTYAFPQKEPGDIYTQVEKLWKAYASGGQKADKKTVGGS